jgi:thiol-disulfide isomerase/thioredoxin
MRTRLLIPIALAFSLLAAACDTHDTPAGTSESSSAVATGFAAPDTVITAFDGTSVTLSDYSGSPVVVNFWASWCPSCVAELGAAIQPAFEAVGDDVAFVGVNIQDEPAAAIEMIEETGVEFDLAVDQDGDLFLAFGAIGMPFTALIDADGRVVARHNGPLTESQLLDLIGEAFRT